MENGRVIVGFSKPYVALYNNSGGTVTYTSGMPLARGVKVSLNVDSTEGNDFFADDVAAESENGQFAGGTANFTVDGLHDAADRFIAGLKEPETVQIGENTVSVQKFSSRAQPPYVGIGFIIHYRSGGVDSYVPLLLTKAKFQTHGLDAATREKETSWQTQDLTADLHRDDTADENWKWVFEGQSTKAAAEAVLVSVLNVASAGT